MASSFLAVVTIILLHISRTTRDISLIDYLFRLHIWKTAKDLFSTCEREGISVFDINSLGNFQLFTPEQSPIPYAECLKVKLRNE